MIRTPNLRQTKRGRAGTGGTSLDMPVMGGPGRAHGSTLCLGSSGEFPIQNDFRRDPRTGTDISDGHEYLTHPAESFPLIIFRPSNRVRICDESLFGHI